MLATVVALAIAWQLLGAVPLDLRRARRLYGGLTALTVPHRLVVEWSRLSGWVLGRGGVNAIGLNRAKP